MKLSRSVTVLAFVALFAAGLGVASLAFGAAKKRAPRKTPRYARIAPACAVDVSPGAPKDEPSPSPAPSKQLLSAFAVLRRDHADTDDLPAAAIAALRARGASFDPRTARLLRTSPGGGKAWIVPVGDVHVLDNGCGPFGPGNVVYDTGPIAVPALPPRALKFAVPRRATPKSAKGARARARTRARRLRAVMSQQAKLLQALANKRRALRPAVPLPVLPGRDARAQKPEEGVAVISTGGAPAGGGGALDDLVRGRAAPQMRPCAGRDGDLTAVSGVVPDGVGDAFLTSPDGTAVKADVNNNSYSFLVAPLSTPAPRYVVWLKDGLPHVQALPVAGLRVRCGSRRAGGPGSGIDLTPNGMPPGFMSFLDANPGVSTAPMAVPPGVRIFPKTPRTVTTVAPVPVPTTPNSAPSGAPPTPAPRTVTVAPVPVPTTPEPAPAPRRP